MSYISYKYLSLLRYIYNYRGVNNIKYLLQDLNNIQIYKCRLYSNMLYSPLKHITSTPPMNNLL